MPWDSTGITSPSSTVSTTSGEQAGTGVPLGEADGLGEAALRTLVLMVLDTGAGVRRDLNG